MSALPAKHRDAIHKAIARWVCKRKRPFSLPEDREFKKTSSPWPCGAAQAGAEKRPARFVSDPWRRITGHSCRFSHVHIPTVVSGGWNQQLSTNQRRCVSASLTPLLIFYNKEWWRIGGVCAWAVATVATSWVSSGVALGPGQAPAPTPGAGFAVKLV